MVWNLPDKNNLEWQGSLNVTEELKEKGIKVLTDAPVDSVFTRTGDVVAATNDYTWAQINKATSDISDITTKSHTSLSDIGTNTHAQIDTHIADTSDPHSVISTIYPIGSIYISTLSTNPATLLGFGTWAVFGAGKILVSLDSADTDFDVVEETGGAKTKTIATANLPNISTSTASVNTTTRTANVALTDPGHTHQLEVNVVSHTTGGAQGLVSTGANYAAGGVSGSRTTGITVSTQPTFTVDSHTHSLGGSGTALNVMNPYIVVYMFKRTA